MLEGNKGCGIALGCPIGTIPFYTNLVNIVLFENDQPGFLYLGNANDCLPKTQMDTQLGLAKQIVENKKPTVNHLFIDVTMFADIIPIVSPSCPGGNPCIGHAIDITYGIACQPLAEL